LSLYKPNRILCRNYDPITKSGCSYEQECYFEHSEANESQSQCFFFKEDCRNGSCRYTHAYNPKRVDLAGSSSTKAKKLRLVHTATMAESKVDDSMPIDDATVLGIQNCTATTGESKVNDSMPIDDATVLGSELLLNKSNSLIFLSRCLESAHG
jgi:hypothetical protein